MKTFKSDHPFSCFAACLATSIFNMTQKQLSQVMISDFLGLGLPNEYAYLIGDLNLKNVIITSNTKEWGLDVDTAMINSLLVNFDLPIECRYKSSLEFFEYEFEEYLDNLIKNNKFPIVGFDYGSYTDGMESEIFGHTIVAIEIKGQSLIGFDPGPKNSGLKSFDLYELLKASKRKRGGIWSFERKS